MVEFMDKFLLMGIPIVLLVPWIVDRLKSLLGLKDAFAGIAAVVVSAVLVALAGLIDWRPELEPVVKYVLGAILLGLGSSGVYSQYKEIKKPDGTPVEPPSNFPGKDTKWPS